MRHFALALFPLLFMPAACGGGGTHESLAEQGLLHLERFGALLEGVKDEASAKAAAPQLEALVGQLLDTKAAVEKLPAKSPELEQALNAKYAERGKAAGMRMMQGIMKIQGDEKIGAILGPTMEKFGKVK
jgi:hypothetical protein